MKKFTKDLAAIILMASIVGVVGCKSMNVSNVRTDTHEYVDLGLPSGILWATCNIGATTPEDYGNYYAWGETETKIVYEWETYKHAKGKSNKLTKYCNNSYCAIGFSDTLTKLEGCDDPATSWGRGWHTPTETQWNELQQNTTNQWTTQNGVKGRLFTASNGNTLFLPAAGYRWDSVLYSAVSDGLYWSRSLDTESPFYAWDLHFDSKNCGMSNDLRGYGFSVRPVRESILQPSGRSGGAHGEGIGTEEKKESR